MAKRPLIPGGWFPLLIFLGVLSAFSYYYLAVTKGYWPFSAGQASDAKGQFGDAFGALTSLFSALGFYGVVLTLWIQRRTATLQSFEVTLFNMLTVHSSIIEDFDVLKKDGTVVRGRDCFRFYASQLRNAYRSELEENPTELDGKLVEKAFVSMYANGRHNLGHYFRFTYNMFRFIHEADIEEHEKLKYSRIIRSQLSDFELVLLFYNALGEHGRDKFKPLIDTYTLFNNLPAELLIREQHRGFHSDAAFNSPKLT